MTEGDARFPTQALPYLANFKPQGKVYNDFLWGGYLIWYERQIPVFVDSRVDIFEYNGTFKDYLDVIHLKDSIEILNKHDIQYVLFEKDAPLVYLLKATRDWKVDYEDKTITITRTHHSTNSREVVRSYATRATGSSISRIPCRTSAPFTQKITSSAILVA